MGSTTCCNHPSDNTKEADLAQNIEAFSPVKGKLAYYLS